MAEDQVNAPQEQSDVQAAAPTSPDAVATDAPVTDAVVTDAPVTEAAATDAPVAEEAQVASQPAPPLAPGKQFIWGTGRRKTAVARVRIRPGTGKFIVNKREATAYFTHERDRQAILGPLEAAKMLKSWDVYVNVNGGGYVGQAGAVVMGLARALFKAVPDVEGALRDQGMMTRDARMKERKKYGQRGARRRFQFSKR
jgi:small subunit ribosomal protein S9